MAGSILPAELAAVVAKMLGRHPDDRFDSMAAAAAALARFATTGTTETSEAPALTGPGHRPLG